LPKKQEIKKPVESSTGTIDILIKSIPEFANFGPRFTSGRPVELTEKETEYAVTSVLHMFEEYMLFMFNCTNTLKDVMLANVTVKMVNNDLKDIKVLFAVPLEKLSYDQPGTVWVAVKKQKDAFPLGVFQCTLKFITKEVDPQTGEPEETGIEDEYQLEDMTIAIRNYCKPIDFPVAEEQWEKTSDEFEVTEMFAFPKKTMNETVDNLVQHFGLQPLEKTDKLQSKKTKHILWLAGAFLGEIPVVIRCRMKSDDAGTKVEISVRSGNDDVSVALVSSI